MSTIKTVKRTARKELAKFYDTLAILRPDITITQNGYNPDEFTILYIRQLQQAQDAIHCELTKLEQRDSGLADYAMNVVESKPCKKR